MRNDDAYYGDLQHDRMEREAEQRLEGIESMKEGLLLDPSELQRMSLEIVKDLGDDIAKAFANPTYLNALLIERLTDEATELYDHKWG